MSPGSLCDASGWCWYDPLPSGDNWLAVAAAGSSDVWIGGDGPTLLHFASGAWTAVSSPLQRTDAIWAASENDVWVGGAGAIGAEIGHWDGQSFTVAANFANAEEVQGIWGSGPNDVYAISGIGGYHWDGSSWSTVVDIGFESSSISGSGPDDVWIANFGLQHFDGTSWSTVTGAPEATSVAVAGPNDVWVAATDVYHFDGSAWSVSLAVALPSISHVAVSTVAVGAGGSHDVWAAGTSFGTTDDAEGYLAHFDGTSWTANPNAPTPVSFVAGTPTFGDLAVGQGGDILTLTSTPTVSFAAQQQYTSLVMRGVWGSSPDDMWAVGEQGTVLHFDGQSVAKVPTTVTANLTDVWGTGPTDVWIVGEGGTLLHFDGQSLASLQAGTAVDLESVFTASFDDVWIGGHTSTLLHFDGGIFQPQPLPDLTAPYAVYDIHGLGPDDVWLSGGDDRFPGNSSSSFVAHFDGTALSTTIVDNGSNYQILRVWELAPDDVWAMTHVLLSNLVGYYHFDGTSWSDASGPSSPTTFMFPDPQDYDEGGYSFVFGPHDRWIVGPFGAWQRNTQ